MMTFSKSWLFLRIVSRIIPSFSDGCTAVRTAVVEERWDGGRRQKGVEAQRGTETVKQIAIGSLSRSLLYLQIRKPVFREYRFVAVDAYRRTVARVRPKRVFRLADYNRMFLLEPTTRGNNLAPLSPLSTVPSSV